MGQILHILFVLLAVLIVLWAVLPLLRAPFTPEAAIRALIYAIVGIVVLWLVFLLLGAVLGASALPF